VKTFTGICVVLIILGASVVRSADSQPQSDSAGQRKYAAVTLLRVINTAEMEFRTSRKQFGNFADLLESGGLDAAGKHFGNAWSDLQIKKGTAAKPLPDYEMHFTVDGSGNSYSVSLREKSNSDAFFTDERGLIYEAKPLQ